ncbi:MAG: hypothetical protein PHE59_02720 [Patescibacteria group bacterium]|nr:hypothetical protein [Patescibacteria group bacterium]MDD5164381.1 hypothetical protein [Patescibacteria group bacterium]MDD5534967.1 hypothetical protein [Patescibacteria group bacterium]
MENFEKQSSENRINEIKNTISKSSEGIEKEFQRTVNSWLACFTSRVFAIEIMMSDKKVEDELGLEKYNTAQEKLEILKQKLFDLKQQYPDRNTVPPDEIKQELLEMLDILN